MAERRGQSEILGLVVIFGIVVSAIALVTATGFAGLHDARDAETITNGVRAFEILDRNVDDLVLGRAPERATEIKLADNQLTLGDPVTIEIRTERIADGHTSVYTRDVVPIEYDLGGGTRLVHVWGGLIRAERSGAVMLHEPTLVLSNRTAVIPLVETRRQGATSVGGAGTVAVRTHLAETELVLADENATRVHVNVTAPHTAVWERYFESIPCDGVSSSGSTTVKCTIDRVESVAVTAVRIDVTLEE